MTTPSVTKVDVIGVCPDDYALRVHFEQDDVPDAWFDPSLIEFVDHTPGSTATVGDRTFIRTEDGGWEPVRESDRTGVPRR